MPSEKIVELRASSALTAITTEYGTSYEDLRKAGVATATTSNKLTDSAGAFTTAGANGLIAVGDILKNTTDGTYALITAIDSATALSISADIMADEEEYEIYTNHGYKFQKSYSELVAILDVTAAATDAADTMDAYLDTSFDGGITWVNIGHFTQIAGNGGAKRFIMSFRAAPIAAANSVDATANQAASAALQIGFGDRVRYRATTANSSTVNNSCTFSLKIHAK